MNESSGRSRLTVILINTAAFIIIVAGLRAASSILVVFLLAVFISVVITPLYIGMQRKKIPSGLALLILILGLVVLTIAASVILGKSVNEFSVNLPEYQEGLQEQLGGIVSWLQSKGLEIPDDVTSQMLNTKTALKLVGNTLTALSAVISNAFVVLLIVIFILFEAAILPAKMAAMPGMKKETRERLGLIIDNFRQYMGMKTLLSLGTGAIVTVMLAVFRIDYAVLLGVLAFLLNYVPNIGSIMAAIPGVALALIQYGPGPAAAVGAGYLILNIVIGNFVEPRVMGKRMGLSPMIIVVSLIFWGWVLGPVGMLLSVPLTMTFRLIMESIEETRGIATLMAASAPSSKRIEPLQEPPATDD